MYTIYCHIFPNGKRYIGLTKHDTRRRFGEGRNYKTCVLLNRAISKYGWNNIEHVILDTVDTKTQAEEKERYYIKYYQSTNPEYGYNILPGGDVSTNPATQEMRIKLGAGYRGKHHSEEEKRKIGEGVKRTFSRPESNGHFGLKMSSEARKKMSYSQKQRWETNPEVRERAKELMRTRMSDAQYREKVLDNLAKYRRKSGEWKMPEEAKRKISAHFKGKWLGENSPCSKPVLQYTLEGEFIKRWPNAGEVERAGITSRRAISNCCHHKLHYHTAGGYKWEFE